jgi:DNA-binding PadR family transcriptional regulator
MVLIQNEISSDILRGYTDSIVLAVLMKKDSYGYEIHKEIIRKAGNSYELKEATLYSAYKRLERLSLIESYWGDETLGARRKYYRITAKGKKKYVQNKMEIEATWKLLRKLIKEDL